MAWPPIGPDDREKCTDFALRALQGAGGDATVLAFCSMALLHVVKEYDLAMAAVQAAADTNPNNMIVVMVAGVAHLHCGDVDDALKLFHRSSRLSPNELYSHSVLTGIAHCYMIKGHYDEALGWASRSRVHAPNYPCNLWILTGANALLGNMPAAHHHLETLTRIVPGVSISKIREGQPGKDPSRLAAILEGLRMAGLPEA